MARFNGERTPPPGLRNGDRLNPPEIGRNRLTPPARWPDAGQFRVIPASWSAPEVARYGSAIRWDRAEKPLDRPLQAPKRAREVGQMGRIALLAAVLVLAWLVLAFGISLAPGLAGYNRPGWQRVDGGPSDGGAG